MGELWRQKINVLKGQSSPRKDDMNPHRLSIASERSKSKLPLDHSMSVRFCLGFITLSRLMDEEGRVVKTLPRILIALFLLEVDETHVLPPHCLPSSWTRSRCTSKALQHQNPRTDPPLLPASAAVAQVQNKASSICFHHSSKGLETQNLLQA